MTILRKPGNINEKITLIDVEWMRVPGILSMYLIESKETEKKCLIDGGTFYQLYLKMEKKEKIIVLFGLNPYHAFLS